MANSIAKKLRQTAQSPSKPKALFLQQRMSQQGLNSNEVIMEKRAQIKYDFDNRIKDIEKRNE